MVCYTLAVALLCGALSLWAGPTFAQSETPARIAVRDGAFLDTGTGAAFTPLGVNYYRVGELQDGKSGHATFCPRYYDRDFIEKMMADLEGWGFNTVRTFHVYHVGEGGILSSPQARVIEAGDHGGVAGLPALQLADGGGVPPQGRGRRPRSRDQRRASARPDARQRGGYREIDGADRAEGDPRRQGNAPLGRLDFERVVPQNLPPDHGPEEEHQRLPEGSGGRNGQRKRRAHPCEHPHKDERDHPR